jgi:hypothetical protein
VKNGELLQLLSWWQVQLEKKKAADPAGPEKK